MVKADGQIFHMSRIKKCGKAQQRHICHRSLNKLVVLSLNASQDVD